jgi:site-specific DNA recombinase
MSTPADHPPPRPGPVPEAGRGPGRHPRTASGRAVPESGPSGLSDYAVSPFGMPTALLRDEVRVAFLGRTSTEEQQDPRQSLMRQLANCKAAIPESWVVVAHFFDVESGRMDLDARGRGGNYERFDIPIARDGGIRDLLDEAAHPGRRFDVVICEGISRVARRAFEGLSVERALDQAEVPLFASNEPITLTGSRAQRVLQRRINQSVAEYEVLNTLEQSWGGLCTHVREGWNIGKPPYGYRAKTLRHPNPAKADRGQTKTRLEPDGAQAETVAQIAAWRFHEQIGYATIAERLNADPATYPPPEPTTPGRARRAWGKTSVSEILRNPKYTGYQVFNRRASRSKRGKVNDPMKWVWSPQPVHEPLIPKWMYDEMTAHRAARKGSRAGNEPNTHPQTRRSYLLRGMVFCGCGRRMAGTHRHQRAYYLCWPKANNRGRPDKYAEHPSTVYLREDALLDAVSAFFADRVFGAHRRDMLTGDLATVDDRATQARHTERERLQRVLADTARRQNTVLRQAQDGDPDDPFTKALRGTYNELEAQKSATLAAVAALDTVEHTAPAKPSTDDAALLDALPYLALNLTDAPDTPLRALFDLTQLTVRLHEDSNQATITIRLPADDLPAITHTAEQITNNPPNQQVNNPCVDAVRAPGGSRTHTGRVLSPLPLPVGLRGRATC